MLVFQVMRERKVKTYFQGEGAVVKRKKVLTKEQWKALQDKFPNGIPVRRRLSDGPPQRSLKIYFIRRSTKESEVRIESAQRMHLETYVL